MLYNLIASSGEAGHRILLWIEYAALVIEILAVVIILGAICYAMGHFLIRAAICLEREEQYGNSKYILAELCCSAWRSWSRPTPCVPWPWRLRWRASPSWACWSSSAPS